MSLNLSRQSKQDRRRKRESGPEQDFDGTKETILWYEPVLEELSRGILWACVASHALGLVHAPASSLSLACKRLKATRHGECAISYRGVVMACTCQVSLFSTSAETASCCASQALSTSEAKFVFRLYDSLIILFEPSMKWVGDTYLDVAQTWPAKARNTLFVTASSKSSASAGPLVAVYNI